MADSVNKSIPTQRKESDESPAEAGDDEVELFSIMSNPTEGDNMTKSHPEGSWTLV